MSDQPLKILIVDNHPLFLESISRILSGPDYDVKTAEGGLQAIDLMKSFIPNIFFIDMIMPYIDGEKLSRYIRAQEEYRNSYIVILSGIAKESDKIAIPSVADGFIAKGPMKHMAGHIFDVIDRYRNKKRNIHFENFLGLSEIEPRHITKELLFSLRHLEVLLQNMQEGVIEIAVDNRMVYINPSAIRILESNEMDLLSKDFLSIFSNGNKEKICRLISEFDSGLEVRDEIIEINKHFVQINIVRVAEGDVEAKIVLLNDVTRFKEKQARLQKTLEEKEMLIREIHHRVKNNLNIISGLISIQSSMINDEKLRSMLLEIQPRLQSISLVHNKLYNTADFINISLNTYLSELATLLIEMMGSPEFPIRLEIDIPEITLSTDKIVALGLICTEIITNAVKYGFYKGNPEENTLRIHLEKGDIHKLSIANNGNPFPENLDITKSKKLGFQVITLLTDQIEGRLEMNLAKGTTFTIAFP